MMKKIAFIGLGVMGYPMAGHLAKAGYQVTVFNRTTAKAMQWASDFENSFATTPKQAAEDADIVFACVGNDDDVRQVALGEEGIFAGLKTGGVFVDHTTASAELARELNRVAIAQGKHFIDAPVSGGQAGAENGQLTVMCGGEQEVFVQLQPIMAAFAKFSQLMGPAGNGQIAKMANQICIAGLVQGLSEALNFAQRAGLDTDKLIETISKGAAGSWQMENRHKTMCAGEYDFGFAVDWMRKDLAITFNEAKKYDAKLPVTEMVDGFYQQIQENGGNRYDTSSLISLLKENK
ncbi:NAD(P)-dependent oxidoreductase [Thalassotalea sp. ND16A]|uniref:NAD(P)-dependent oxidoreductase n=1 Tax=Thalassotalea sp. ND16A TaxID=1535422 RepID=UPI00126A2F87|nr:NAD(P)-dependent oxidoreductase [Thalassotalea sp. ND16A]